jgi:hypothetical protein
MTRCVSGCAALHRPLAPPQPLELGRQRPGAVLQVQQLAVAVERPAVDAARPAAPIAGLRGAGTSVAGLRPAAALVALVEPRAGLDADLPGAAGLPAPRQVSPPWPGCRAPTRRPPRRRARPGRSRMALIHRHSPAGGPAGHELVRPATRRRDGQRLRDHRSLPPRWGWARAALLRVRGELAGRWAALDASRGPTSAPCVRACRPAPCAGARSRAAARCRVDRQAWLQDKGGGRLATPAQVGEELARPAQRGPGDPQEIPATEQRPRRLGAWPRSYRGRNADDDPVTRAVPLGAEGVGRGSLARQPEAPPDRSSARH